MIHTSPRNSQPIDLLSSKQVAHRLSVSVRTVWRLTKRGTLPAPIRYSRKLVRWRTTDIEGFVTEQVRSVAYYGSGSDGTNGTPL